MRRSKLLYEEVQEVAAWLDAALYVTDFRPVPLQEHVVVGSTVHFPDAQVVRELAVEGPNARKNRSRFFARLRKFAENVCELFTKVFQISCEAFEPSRHSLSKAYKDLNLL